MQPSGPSWAVVWLVAPVPLAAPPSVLPLAVPVPVAVAAIAPAKTRAHHQ